MKAVMLSLRPQWCEKIFNGEKTIEVRKTAPKLETPFKVYVYCTKERMTRVPSMYAYLHKNEPRACAEYGTIETWGEIGDVIVNPHLASKHVSFGMHGKVIGSFICDRIDEIEPDLEYYSDGYDIDDDRLAETCLSREQLREYGKGFTLYGWHITAPTLYDKPRELGEFYVPCKKYNDGELHCMEWDCEHYSFFPDANGDAEEECLCKRRKPLRHPPQSWCYVEELQ